MPPARTLLALFVLLTAGCPPPPPAPRARPAPLPRTVPALATHLCTQPPGNWTGLFTPAWRDGRALERVAAAFETHRRLYGPCAGVRHGGGLRVVYRYRDAEVPGRLVVTAQGLIAGVWFQRARVPGDSWGRLVADLRRLPGATSLSVVDASGRVIAAHQPDQPMAVASSFKLYLLKALQQEVTDGRMRWDDVVRLDPRRRSLPTAPLNRWPDGAPLTLQTLATWMIARSDNTATDHLLFHLGRELVEKHAGTFNRPLLSTREMFALKGPRGRPAPSAGSAPHDLSAAPCSPSWRASRDAASPGAGRCHGTCAALSGSSPPRRSAG